MSFEQTQIPSDDKHTTTLPHSVAVAINTFYDNNQTHVNMLLQRAWSDVLPGMTTKGMQGILSEHTNTGIHKHVTEFAVTYQCACAVLSTPEVETTTMVPLPGMGSWLTCRPTTQANTDIRTAFKTIGQWICVYPNFAPDQHCSHQINTSICHSMLCEMGHRVFVCAKRARYATQHNVRYLICNGARKAVAIATAAQLVPFVDTTSRRRTLDKPIIAGIRIQEHLGHNPQWVDVVNVRNCGWNSKPQQYHPSTIGIAVNTQENNKHATRIQCMDIFYPFAIDTFGRIGQEGRNLFQRLAASLKAKKLGSARAFKTSRL